MFIIIRRTFGVGFVMELLFIPTPREIPNSQGTHYICIYTQIVAALCSRYTEHPRAIVSV